MQKLIDKAEKILEGIATIILIALLVIIWLQVFTRYVLGNPFRWTEESARYLMIWGVLLGSSISFLNGHLIAMNMFVDKLPSKILFIVKIIRKLLAFMFLGILIYFGIQYSITGLKLTSPSLGIKYFWIYVSIPIGSTILFIFLLFKPLKYKKNVRAEASKEKNKK